MRGNTDRRGKNNILVRKEEVIAGSHHGGSWKVAYADFVTAMMAFFLLMWLLNATTEAQRKGLADYFSPNAAISHNSSGTGLPFGGRTAFSQGAMLSDLGTPQVTVGQQPVVDDVDDDGSQVIAQPRPHREDSKSQAPDLGGRPPPQTSPRPSHKAGKYSGANAAVDTTGSGDAPRKPTEDEFRAELQRSEKQDFERAAQQVREAVASDPQLAQLAPQLAVDMTPEGLRIQIRDAEREAMFPLGSAVPNEKAKLLLQKVASVLARMTQDISIAGHTDAAPYAGAGFTNWELSADRANATRRLLVDSGLQPSRIRSVTGNAERDLAVPNDPLAAANRRISILVMRAGQLPPSAQ